MSALPRRAPRAPSLHPASGHPGRLRASVPPLRALPPALTVLAAICALPAQAADAPVLLPAITVTQTTESPLREPASTGSGLALTPLQTPASLDVITREQIEARGDASIVDAITRAAGISAMGHPGNGGMSLSARGFTDTTSVMRLYDGTRQYGGVGLTFPFDTWSVERIDVLRGPASVIYGDGAIGGVVNIIPKKPHRGRIENEVEATVGSDDTFRLGLGSGGSISDTLSYRLDASGDRSDGWVDQGDSRNRAFSAALRWDLSPDLAVTLSHAQGRQKPMRYFGVPLVDSLPLDALREKNYDVGDGRITYRDNWTELAAAWTPSDALAVRTKLYHIASKRHYRNAETYAYNTGNGMIDRSGYSEILHDQEQTGATADARIQGRLFGLANQFSVGFDASQSRFKRSSNISGGPSDAVDPYDPEPGRFHSATPTLARYRNQARQFAFFAENRLSLTDSWSVLGGLRYDHTSLSRRDLPSQSTAFRRTYASKGWRLGTVYEVTPDLSVYAQYSRAADPVGSMLLLSTANSAFDLSTGRQIEVGVKQAFAEGRGEWTVALYDIRKNNLLTRDPADPSQRVQVGEQSSRGVEGTLALDIARNWRVEANATLLRAQYEDFSEPVGSPPVAVSRKGRVPPNVAERLANLWLSWRFQPDWTASAGLRYVGKRYADSANTLEMPSYTTTDLALRWQATRDTTLTARALNVFDRDIITTAYYTPTQWLHGPGRRYELTLNHRF